MGILKGTLYSGLCNNISVLTVQFGQAAASIDEDTTKKSSKTWEIVHGFYCEEVVVISTIF